MRQGELWAYLTEGPPSIPAYDAGQHASEALQEILKTEVVLTTYNTLQQEIYFDPEAASQRQFRGEKRYLVAKSPLLQVLHNKIANEDCIRIRRTHK